MTADNAKRLLTGWFALIFFGVVLLLALWFNMPADRAPTNPPPARHVEISAVGQPTLRFTHANGEWRMTAPLSGRANQARIRLLLNLRSQIPDDAKPTGQTDAPLAKITIAIDGETWGLGEMTEDRQYRHVSHRGKDYLVNNPWVGEGEIAPTDYLDPRLLPEGARITRLQLPGLRLSKKPNGAWRAEPAQPVSTGALAALVTNWQLAYASALAHGEQNTSNAPEVIVHYRLAGGEPVTQTFHLIQRTPRLQLYAAKRQLSYFFPADIADGLLDLQKVNAEGEDALEPRI